MKQINTVLISVFDKQGLDRLLPLFVKNNIKIYSTGGTYKFIKEQNIPAVKVESITQYPAILGGRVKTLHPKVFGGILSRRSEPNDQKEIQEYDIPEIDLVIVDLYPFEKTVNSESTHQEIIEKIDIGGISLIRAAAKNYNDVLTISNSSQYAALEKILEQGNNTQEIRKDFARVAFATSSHYDTQIYSYFEDKVPADVFRASSNNATTLRYGENPHQQAVYYGKLDKYLIQLNGKALSYNNLVDVDAAIQLIQEFDEGFVFAILKHTNPCGIAIGSSILDAYDKSFEADSISAFGGILISNSSITQEAALAIHKLFFEVIIAPDFQQDALQLLSKKKNRIILKQIRKINFSTTFKSLLGGIVSQDGDLKTIALDKLEIVTEKKMSSVEQESLIFAMKVVKHCKSNAIVLTMGNQLIAHGVGQTSRVDALNQAIKKAKSFGFSLKNAVLASDAFFPFPDCVNIAAKEGITAIVQPGGSIKDQESIDACNKHNIAMAMTGIRHFRH